MCILGLTVQEWYYAISLALAGGAIWLLNKRTNSARDQVEVAEADSLSNRFQKAANMIDSERRSTRVAGFYSLKHLVEAHPTDYHIMTMELTCMFLRNPPLKEGDTGTEPLKGARGGLREDMQAAMAVIGARNQEALRIEEKKRFTVYLGSACLEELVLDNANLSRAIMTAASLDQPTVMRAHDVFASVQGGGETLRLAIFHNTDFSNARLLRADCQAANFYSCQFIGSRLDHAYMKGATFEDVDFSDAVVVEADFTASRFDAKCRLTQAQLDSAKADPKNIPTLAEGLLDYKTKQPLVWNTAHCGRSWTETKRGEE